MLFRYDDEGKLTDHIFVDFQLPLWNSPVIDILHFLNRSPAEDVELHHREALLKEYLNVLTKTMSKICCKTKPPTMAALNKSIKDYEFYSVMSSCLFLSLTLFDENEIRSCNEIMQDNEFIHRAYKGRAYRKIMLRRLPEWNARGLIDI